MMMMLQHLLAVATLLLVLSTVSVAGFSASSLRIQHPTGRTLRAQATNNENHENMIQQRMTTPATPAASSTDTSSSRRNFLSTVPASALSLGLALTLNPTFARADEARKVLVLGGTGLVGSRVVSSLQTQGISVVSTSRNGRDGTVALDFVQESSESLGKKVAQLASGCTAVISCVGAIGTDDDQKVNAATGIVARAAKQAGVSSFVYITVAPEVVDFAKDLDFLKPYMAGKASSRAAVLASFPGASSTLIEPTFIYGGDSFAINPPRVAGFYGSFIEGLLASGPVRAVEGVMPAGILKIALEPPVSAETVANAAVAGALGKSPSSILDSHDKIVQAAALL